MSTVVTEQDKRTFLAALAVTPDDVARADAVQQRDPAWFELRANRLSASNFGAVAGQHEHGKGAGSVLREMLWPKRFSSDATEYGTVMEATAYRLGEVAVRDTLLRYGFEQVWFENTGTRVWAEHPWLCASADALVHAVGRIPDALAPKSGMDAHEGAAHAQSPAPLPSDVHGVCEFKCPYSKKAFYPLTPREYYAQFQGQAAIHGLEFIVFLVYTPEASQINYYRRDPVYWDDLFGKLRRFYMEDYLPRAILKQRGLLTDGQIDLVPVINVHITTRPSDEPERTRHAARGDRERPAHANRDKRYRDDHGSPTHSARDKRRRDG